ncbi:transporter substrate-binding domain-containing protein [Hahella sp. SMD15-11]|uniref:Transporter substrate-binding domain-containing protein n=1 Tax=Thermohahella caldifontis TaxID=3142973 RepID=A0AB39V131_9GAMM
MSLIFATLSWGETITLANGEWAPYLSEKLKKYGFVSDIVTQSFEREGVTVKYVFLPWKRGYEEAKNGKLNGSLVWSRTEEREQFFDYSDPVIRLETVLFVRKGGGFDWDGTPQSLSGKSLGGVIGYSYGLDEAEKAGTVKISRITSADANLQKVAAGRLDAFIEDRQVGMELVNKLGLADKIEVHPKPIKMRDYHLILNKKQPENKALMEKFNRGLKALREDGTYDAIVKAAQAGEYN